MSDFLAARLDAANTDLTEAKAELATAEAALATATEAVAAARVRERLAASTIKLLDGLSGKKLRKPRKAA